ncbi:MAG TPA: hypothetical protein VKU61_13815 [Candidatus Binatia bacterium]|nr:hypothetical protein [Candidatus Binatia bacterium]
MESYARRLFGIAALANFLFAFVLLFLRPVLASLVGLDPVAGTNRVFVYLTGTLVGAFGYAYLRVAGDPRRFRPFVELGAIGKLLAVTAATVPWLAGEIGWRLPFLIGGDLVFALLFIDYLRRTQPA